MINEIDRCSSSVITDNQHSEIIYCKSTVDLGKRFLQSLQ